MRDSWRHFVSEFIGTFALVFVGSGAIMATRITQSSAALVEVALAHGLVLGVMVSALMRISGHFNPAVTLGFLAARRIEPMMAALYVVSQVVGAVAAGYALKAGFPDSVFVATRGGGQTIALDISGGQAFLLEVIATFFLVFVIFGS
jgi:aquaporin Z